MADDPGAREREGQGGVPARSPVVFVSDASAEAERIADTLRAVGYVVVDVPMSMLASRSAAQRPNVVLVDVDADGVLDEVARVRRQPGSAAIDFLYVGTGEGRIKNADDALSNDGSAFFLRPVDVGGMMRKIEALTGGPAASREVRSSTPPPSLPATRGDRPSTASLASLEARAQSMSLRTPGPPLPMSSPSLADLVDPPRSLATFGTVSHELQQLLAEAELRAEVLSNADAPVPTPEEEIESVLPADVLASLDEPLEGDEDDDADVGRAVQETSPGREGAHAKGTTSTGTQKPTTASGRSSGGSQTHERRLPSEVAKAPPGAPTVPARRSLGEAGAFDTMRLQTPPDAAPRTTHPPSAEATTGATTGAGTPARPPTDAPRGPSPSWSPPPLASAPPASVPSSSAGVVLGPGDARRFVGEAVARRATGALCFDHDGVVRRVVLRDGDFVTAASGAERESLVVFLGARGELPRDEVERLSAKIPPYGRHAGAALVAHGWLRQDQLWSVLRAHAEWVASIVLRLDAGTASHEADPPGRLRAEPGVFGASTGPEIFVELVRRAIPVDDAIAALGGPKSRIADGAQHGLLAECNLSPHDMDLVSRARGGSVADLLARAPDAEIASVVHALALLGVLESIPSPDFARGDDGAAADPEVAALDEDAVRTRVRARLELVDEGDYFAVLGVARDATPYEVRRAFLELRRGFEPSRILTPRTADLADDVRKIVAVLEEAYEILRDNARRERYRRAIEARPE